MSKKPIITELTLSKEYRFLYENFMIATQGELYLLLENRAGRIDTLKFDFVLYKYGYPNDEGLGVHPMAQYGLRSYGLFRVDNSVWIGKLRERKAKTSWDLFEGRQHYIITFKDVTLDIISKGFEELTLTEAQIMELTQRQINHLNMD